MVDANQKWSVPEAIIWMKKLAKFKLHWIEEPTSPDDVLGTVETRNNGNLGLLEFFPLLWSFSLFLHV